METNTVHIENEAASLLVRCRKGEETAFRELYNLYNKAMYNICVRMLGQGPEAEDALQESFISAFANLRQFQQKSSFGAWLKRIVINRCIDVIRKKKNLFVGLNEAELSFEEAEDPEAYTIESIWEALLRLPDGYRVVLTLHLFEDYPHRLIAEKLGISEGTSKSQYARARKKLIQIINENKVTNG